MRSKQLGLSLIELMIAITLGIVLMTGVVQMFLSSKVVFTTQQGMSRIQETGRLAIEFLSRDIRMAAYYGCLRPLDGQEDLELQNKNLVINGLHGNFNQGIVGYTDVMDVPGGQSAIGSSLTMLDADNVADILVIHSANEVGFPISALNTPTSVFAYRSSPLEDGCADSLCPGSAAVVNDCHGARVFQVSSLNLAGTTLTVNHADSWGGGSMPLQNFSSGELLPMNTTVYFLAQGASGAPSLWQKTNNEAAIELLEGVEHMQFTYAIQDSDPDSLPDNYILASAVAADEWKNVVSVRIELVVRSLENNVIDETQPYIFGGVEVIPPDMAGLPDRHMRQVFSATVGIRSRSMGIQ